MKRTYWIFAACLSLMLVGGLALNVSAQQTPPPAAAPSAPAPSAPAATTPDTSSSTTPDGTMQRENPSTSPSTNTQIESRTTERTTVVERDGGRIFGVQPVVALVIGAALLVVIVIGLVAMSRRSDEVVHTHRV